MKNLKKISLFGLMFGFVGFAQASWFKRSPKESRQAACKQLKRVPAVRDLHAALKADNAKNFKAAQQLVRLPKNASPYDRAVAEQKAFDEFQRNIKQ